MSDSYNYLDSDYTYIDPNTGLLRNKANISDKATLLFVESGAVAKRIQELNKNPIKIEGIESLFKIHEQLFQDIYSWAGKKRTVEISKEGKQFFPTTHLDNALSYIDNLILEFRNISKDNKKQLAKQLAEILDNVNYLHPFREGNGRAQREFLRLLALEKGLVLNLNPPDNKRVYDQYMKGTINSDVDSLFQLIFNQINF